MNHTPGPWFTFETKDDAKRTVQTICSVATYEESIANEDVDLTLAGIWSDQDIDKANAILMATSPELLDCCKEAVIDIDAFDAQCGDIEYTDTDQVWQLLNDIRDNMKEVIAKAKG